MRVPSREEREILDFLWSEANTNASAMGDFSVARFDDEAGLRRVIRENDTSELVNYALVALARTLAWDSKNVSANEEALEVVTRLKASMPDFRKEALARLHGLLVFQLGDRAEANRIFRSEVRRMPYLVDVFEFMSWRLPIYSSDPNNFRDWKRSREMGTPFRIELEDLESIQSEEKSR
ncbi:MAG: hypothetical protein IH969_07630 [Candidatus Krumholzibacteriota bacterium]|nr:hypothetical protein [Candidatus Krumholzibacteriota bacterium]